MSTLPTTIDLLTDAIVSTKGTCGGKPRIAGTRVRVVDIYVMHELQGKCPDEIVDAYPTITLGDVHAALAYYYKHSEAIKADYADIDRVMAEVRKKLGPSVAETAHLDGRQ
jgi:uncharacterized protein (DUF433 family)